MLIYIIAWIWNNYVRVTHNLFLPLGVLLLLHENWCSLNNVGHMLRSGPSLLFGTICLELIFLSNFILLTSRHNGVPVKIFEKLEKKTFNESDPKSELAQKVSLPKKWTCPKSELERFQNENKHSSNVRLPPGCRV